jgi:hypothetical protein
MLTRSKALGLGLDELSAKKVVKRKGFKERTGRGLYLSANRVSHADRRRGPVMRDFMMQQRKALKAGKAAPPPLEDEAAGEGGPKKKAKVSASEKEPAAAPRRRPRSFVCSLKVPLARFPRPPHLTLLSRSRRSRPASSR